MDTPLFREHLGAFDAPSHLMFSLQHPQALSLIDVDDTSTKQNNQRNSTSTNVVEILNINFSNMLISIFF
jgi:hypothetical protein